MGADSTQTHTDENLPGAGAPPAEKTDESPIGKARVFAHAKRTLIAVVVAAFATLKIGKWAVLGLWNVRGVDQVKEAPDWALHHWLIVLLVAAALFAGIFTVTRFALGKL